MTATLGPVLWLMAVAMPAWFGHIRYWTPVLHKDDHRDLSRQAMRLLIRGRVVPTESEVARHRKLIEESCGLLDIVEVEHGPEISDGLEWGYSHFYDPVAGHGIDDGRFVNALQEYNDYWERSLAYRSAGDKERAYALLGYCCHLLQDMAVPAHTYCVVHGLANRTADNLELTASSRHFDLGAPVEPLLRGEGDLQVRLFVAMGMESRGRDSSDPEKENEIAPVLSHYYAEPCLTDDGWLGSYKGKSYYHYHRLLPSSPRIRRADVVKLRDHLMAKAVKRTAQLIEHFARVTGAGGGSA